MNEYRLWSNKHGKWWRPGGLGYTDNPGEAGWFDAETALKALISSAYGSEPGSPGLVLVADRDQRFTLAHMRTILTAGHVEHMVKEGWRQGGLT